MKFSLVTVCYNSGKTIADTLRSVSQQTVKPFEYIVVDGGSTDATLDILREQGAAIVSKLIPGPDRGIYDAMNKGLAVATGDVIGFINADDFYASDRVLEKVGKAFADDEVDACYGDLCYVRQDDVSAIVRYWRSSPFRPKLFEKGWCPPHPTFFVRRRVYERFGNFDLSYRIAADVELMMRFLEKHHIKSEYLPETLVLMRTGGTTNKSLRNIIRQNREIMRALGKCGLRSSPGRFFLNKLVSRGKQFVVRPASGG